MCCHMETTGRRHQEKLTEAFTRNIWLCRENNTQKECKAGEEAVTADITKVDRNR